MVQSTEGHIHTQLRDLNFDNVKSRMENQKYYQSTHVLSPPPPPPPPPPPLTLLFWALIINSLKSISLGSYMYHHL